MATEGPSGDREIAARDVTAEGADPSVGDARSALRLARTAAASYERSGPIVSAVGRPSESPDQRRARADLAAFLLRGDLGVPAPSLQVGGRTYRVIELGTAGTSTSRGFVLAVDTGSGNHVLEAADNLVEGFGATQGEIDIFLNDLPTLIRAAEESLVKILHTEWCAAWEGSVSAITDLAGIDYLNPRVELSDLDDLPDDHIENAWQDALPELDDTGRTLVRDLHAASRHRERFMRVTAGLSMDIADLIRQHVQPGRPVPVFDETPGGRSAGRRSPKPARFYGVDERGNVVSWAPVRSLVRVLFEPVATVLDWGIPVRGSETSIDATLQFLRDGAQVVATILGQSDGAYHRIPAPVMPPDESPEYRFPFWQGDGRSRVRKGEQESIDWRPSDAVLTSLDRIPFEDDPEWKHEYKKAVRTVVVADHTGRDVTYTISLRFRNCSDAAEKIAGTHSFTYSNADGNWTRVGDHLDIRRNGELVLQRDLVPPSQGTAAHWTTSYSWFDTLHPFVLHEYRQLDRHFGLKGPRLTRPAPPAPPRPEPGRGGRGQKTRRRGLGFLS